MIPLWPTPGREAINCMLNFKELLQGFLALREWDDEIKYNSETDEWYITTNVSVNNQPIRLIIEGCDETQILGIYFYLNINFIDSKYIEMTKICNWINPRVFIGHLECLHNGAIRWVQKIDCEGATLSPHTLSVNVQHGWGAIEQFSIPITSVALSQASCEAAIEAFLEKKESEKTILH